MYRLNLRGGPVFRLHRAVAYNGYTTLEFVCRDDYGVMDVMGHNGLTTARNELGELLSHTGSCREEAQLKASGYGFEHASVNSGPLSTIAGDSAHDDGVAHWFLISFRILVERDTPELRQWITQIVEAMWRSFRERHTYLDGALMRNPEYTRTGR